MNRREQQAYVSRRVGWTRSIGILGWIVLVLWLSSCLPFAPSTKSASVDGLEGMAGSGEWAESEGPMQCCRWNHYVIDGGGGQTSLAVSPLAPNIVYATMDHGGIVKSVDHGDTWQTINNNIGSTRLAEVKLDPLDPDIVYVTASPCLGCGEGELYRSLDGGSSWEFLTSEFGVEKWPSCRGLVILPEDRDGDYISDVIYAGAWAGNKGGDKGGVWRSSDEGATWQQIGRIGEDAELLKRASVWVLKADPSDPSILYAGLYAYDDLDAPDGLLKSTDGGLTWADVTHGIPVRNISDIGITPGGNTLYVATNAFARSESGAGIYKSTDAGGTWRAVNRGLGRTSLKFEVLLVDKDDPDVVYTGPFRGGAGMYRTTDGGDHWRRAKVEYGDWWGERLGNLWAIAEGSDSSLYAATWNGIYRSYDDGKTWMIRSRGLGNILVYDIALDPTDPSIVYLGLADRGPWKSVDRGRTWLQIARGYYRPYRHDSGSVSAFAISPSDPDVIYSAVRGSSGSTLMGVNKTRNGGKRWKAVNRGLPGPEPAWLANDVVVDPRDAEIAYVGIQFVDGRGAVFKTTDGGRNWSELMLVGSEERLSSVTTLAISASDPGTVLVGTREPGRVYRTNDGGISWTDISPRVDMMNPETIIRDIDVHPGHPEYILIGVNIQGAFLTSDGGQEWVKVMDSEFLRSHAGYLALNPQVSMYATIGAVKFDPDDPKTFYLGHQNQGGRAGLGVLRSSDGGLSWRFVHGPGLQYRNIFDIEIHPRTKELLVGGFDGVYIYERFSSQDPD